MTGDGDRKKSDRDAVGDCRVPSEGGNYEASPKGSDEGAATGRGVGDTRAGPEILLPPAGENRTVGRLIPQGWGSGHLSTDDSLSCPAGGMNGVAKAVDAGGVGREKYSSAETLSVEKALHGVLEALRKVREERLRRSGQAVTR